MILLAADNHYGTHGSRVIYDALRSDYAITFIEDDWSELEVGNLRERFSLLALAIVAGSCNVPFPDGAAADAVQAYIASGGDLLLLHGGSAAFWHCDWWRPLVGYRWVRAHDPDGFERSAHPTRPYHVAVAKCRHPLCARLQAFDMPADEIYTRLEQTRPTTTLMETTTDEGTFPMCYETATPHGGRLLAYLPGHAPDAIRTPANLANIRTLLDDFAAPCA